MYLLHFSSIRQTNSIPRSATFTTRSAISSILSSAPEKTRVSRTKTWSGPLDNTLLNLVGEKCSNLNLLSESEEQSARKSSTTTS